MAQYLDPSNARSYGTLKRDRLTAGFREEEDLRFPSLSPMEQILFGLTLPSEAPQVIRYNGPTSGNPTSAKSLLQDQKINWQNVTVDKALPAAEQMVFLFRNALRSFIYFDNNPTGLTYDYQVYNSTDLSDHFDLSGSVGADFFTPPFAYAKPTQASVYQPHGDFFFPGEARNRYGFWCDNSNFGASSTIGVHFRADPTAAGANIYWYDWDGVNWVPAHLETTAAGVVDYYQSGPVFGGCYKSLDIKINNIAASVFEVHVKSAIGATGVWCHRSIPNISELLPIINGVRVNAASVLWTNFSSELQASGKVVSVSVPACLPWSNIAISQSNLTQLQGYESRQAKTGAYSFLRPDGPNDFDFTNDVKSSFFRSNKQVTAVYPICERSSYVAISLSVANVDARDTSLQICHAIEYLTDSKIQEVDFSRYDQATWTAAIQKCREIPQHYENKFHFGRLFRKIVRIGRSVFNVVKGAAPIIGMMGPVGRAIGSGIQMADALGAGKLLDIAAGGGSN